MGRAEDLFKKIEHEGEAAIDELIATRKSEELFLDFKRSSNNGSAQRLSDTDRNNFAKAISGFGNSEGGVIVWGIDCSRDTVGADVARFKVPITDAARYTSWLEGVVSGCTVPPHQGVRSFPIVAGTSTDGYVATLIPKSNHAPHQVVGRLQYYIRAGSNFVPAPHAVLAGMFGRRPQPSVFHMYSVVYPTILPDNPRIIKADLGLQLVNAGPGIASDLFMTIRVSSIPGSNCDLFVEPTNREDWIAWSFLKVEFSAISKNHIRLPPDTRIHPFVLSLRLAPPFSRKLKIQGLCGCGQSPSFSFRLENEPALIEKLYNDFLRSHEEGQDFQANFWNISEPSELYIEAYHK